MSKVSIIGGAGRVGVSFAFHLLTENICHELVLVDIDEEMVQGERLDLMHSTSSMCKTKISAGTDYHMLAGSDIIVIPAGARRKPDQTRLELIKTNFGIIDEWMWKINRVAPNALVLVVVNPVDVLTYRAFMVGGQNRHRIFGLGNVMDVVRVRSNIAEFYDWDSMNVYAKLLGEHGDAMVPIYSQMSYAGYRLMDMPDVKMEDVQGIIEKTRKAGAEVIRLKQGAGWAVGVAITAVVRAVLLDEKRVLSVSSIPNGAFGIDGDVALSLPTIIGKDGVEGYLNVKLADEEMEGIKHAAEVLRKTYSEIA